MSVDKRVRGQQSVEMEGGKQYRQEIIEWGAEE